MLEALENLCRPVAEPFLLAGVFAEARRIQAERSADEARKIGELQGAVETLEQAIQDFRAEGLRAASEHLQRYNEFVRAREAATANAVALTERIDALTLEMAVTLGLRDQAIEAARLEVLALRSSTSWKLTEPLRRVATLLRGR